MKKLMCSDEVVNKIYELTKGSVEKTIEDRSHDLKVIKEIVEPLMKLVDEAKQKKMYLYLTPHNRWFSPDDLEGGILNGYYIYTSDLWTIRNPVERIDEMENEVIKIKKELREFRIDLSRYLYGGKEKKIVYEIKKSDVKW